MLVDHLAGRVIYVKTREKKFNQLVGLATMTTKKERSNINFYFLY